MKTFFTAALLAAAVVAGFHRLSIAEDKPTPGPEPVTFTCAMGMEYEQKVYSAIPLLRGLSRIIVDGDATIACPGRDPIKLRMHGAGFQAGLQTPSGANPFVHKGKRVSGHFNVRVPSLFTARDFEGSYFYTGATSPVGGAEVSPFLNSNAEADVVLFMPADLDIAAGWHFKTITLKK